MLNKNEVNHPDHYNEHPSGVECIDVIEHFPLNVGNSIKYLWRLGLKGGSETAEKDLRKAIWYLERELWLKHGGKDDGSEFVAVGSTQGQLRGGFVNMSRQQADKELADAREQARLAFERAGLEMSDSSTPPRFGKSLVGASLGIDLSHLPSGEEGLTFLRSVRDGSVFGFGRIFPSAPHITLRPSDNELLRESMRLHAQHAAERSRQWMQTPIFSGLEQLIEKAEEEREPQSVQEQYEAQLEGISNMMRNLAQHDKDWADVYDQIRGDYEYSVAYQVSIAAMTALFDEFIEGLRDSGEDQPSPSIVLDTYRGRMLSLMDDIFDMMTVDDDGEDE